MKFEKLTTFLSLFTSLSTLLCCALPALFVSLGMGFVVAGMTSQFPFLITLSEHKNFLFLGGAFLLLISGVLIKHSLKQPCPIDPQKAKACQAGRRFSKITFWVSVVIFSIGTLFAYILPYFMEIFL